MKFGVPQALALIVILASALSYTTSHPRDDTDPPDGRSGMRLYVDHGTGCQYLQAPSSNLIPRLNASGTHLCR